MHFSRKLILLAAFMVGLGFIGSGELHAAEAIVTSVEITSPDSGSLVGIDGKFQVRVEVEDYREQPTLEVHVFLLQALGDPADTDPPTQALTLFGDGDAPGFNPSEAPNVTGGDANFVGVNTTKNMPIADAEGAQIDGDSLVVADSDDETTVYIWYGEVHASSGHEGGIRAAAYISDPGHTDPTSFSNVVFSEESIDIDANRPENPDDFAIHIPSPYSFAANLSDLVIGTTKVQGLTDADPPALEVDGNNDPVYTDDFWGFRGESNDVSGFGSPTPGRTTHEVLGIGDTLSFQVELGTTKPFTGRDDDFTKVILNVLGKTRTVYERGGIESDTEGTIVTYTSVIKEGEFDDLDEDGPYDFDKTDVTGDPPTDVAHDGITGEFEFFFVDKAGNLSSEDEDDVDPEGASVTTSLLIDGKKPALDSTKGDTIQPASVDTISDGGLNTDVPKDENPVKYNLANTLESLTIEFDGATKDTLKITQGGALTVNDADFLQKGTDYTVDLTRLGIAGSGPLDTLWVATGDQGRSDDTRITKDAIKDEIDLKDGSYKVVFSGTDVAGNVGPKLTRESVYVDVTDISFDRSFPFGKGENESGLDTVEAKTSVVVFRLSEPADSVTVTYKGVQLGASGTTSDVDSLRTYHLVGGQLTTTSIPQEFPIPGLVQGNRYALSVVARDLAGNWGQSAPDSFWYDTSFVVPQAAKIEAAIQKGETKPDKGILAVVSGDTVTVQLTAKSVDDKIAVTYDQSATVTVAGGRGIDLIEEGTSSTGATDNGDGTFTLNSEDWVVGGRKIAFRDTVSIDSLTISIADDADSTLVGKVEAVTVVKPSPYTQLIVSVPDTVTQGENFIVNVLVADKFGNQQVDASRFVAISSNTIGVQVPPDAVLIAKGAGSFPVNSSGWSGDLTISVRDIAGDGANNTLGTAALHVRASDAPVVPDPPEEEAPDAPDQLVAEDYAGASGEGDQGGFVLLTWDASDDHDSLDKYRVYRQLAVSTVMDEETGNLVTLEEPTTALVHWGTIDAIPGADVMRVVVATLDSDAAAFGVAAERGGRSSKQAFGPGQNVENPYELMAQTMSRSREAAQPVSDAPVFATLSPEALAYQAKGVAPLLKSVDSDVLRSEITKSEVVRSIDNIPPGAIPYLKVLDTPGDAGGSIRVTWTTSPDDRMLTTTVGSAIGLGGHVYSVAGVAGYNVYRKIGDGAFELIGKAGSGATSFDDATVFNGVRYTYQVKPYDIDNETDSELEGTAMAIRNQVLDANGNVVLGLFGSDDKVGFDDFFILADQFGMTVEDEDFEPAFDLSPNNKIDLNDFFTFADFFGRTVEGAGKALPISMAGLNSDARFYLDAGTELPRVGEEMAILVSLEDFVELKGYGFSVSYDPQVLTYVGTRVENSILGAGEFAEGQLVSHKDGLVSLVTYGDVATEGDLGLSLLFRSLQEIEDSYIDIVNAEVRDGNYGLNTLATPVSVRIQTRPEVYALRNNFPNPFNPETTLKYDLPEAGDVKLEVYNMLGQVVRTLVNEHQTAGRYAVQWDATNGHGQSMSSGIYFYRVQVEGEFTDVKKMLLLK